ncbi:hypothetical protein BGW80DRAFT_53827 [Lactifluus volemus]|nr:hypothetical protein BGW80DRAFT_53827 [Lactifluus volemus]
MNTLLPVSFLGPTNPATTIAVGVCAHPLSRATTVLHPISSIPSGMAQATAEVFPLIPDPYTVGPGNLNSPVSPPPAVSYGLLSSVSAAPTELPLVTTTDSATLGTMSAMLQGQCSRRLAQ